MSNAATKKARLPRFSLVPVMLGAEDSQIFG